MGAYYLRLLTPKQKGWRFSPAPFYPARVLPRSDWFAGAHLGQTGGQQFLQRFESGAEAFDSFLQLVVSHLILSVHLLEDFFIHRNLLDLQLLGIFRVKLAGQISWRVFEFFQ